MGVKTSCSLSHIHNTQVTVTVLNTRKHVLYFIYRYVNTLHYRCTPKGNTGIQEYTQIHEHILTGSLSIKTHTLKITVEQLESMADWRDQRLKSAMMDITLCDILSNYLNENSSLQKCGLVFSLSSSVSVTKSITGKENAIYGICTNQILVIKHTQCATGYKLMLHSLDTFF